MNRFYNTILSILIAILSIPMYMVVYLLILLIDRHNPIFIQERLGKRYAVFYCIKFRTMNDKVTLDHEVKLSDHFMTYRKLHNDPRVTKLGRILRSSSLDELPQFINVILGDMDIVGPRPIMLDEIEHYGEHISQYVTVRPGITGLWQVSGRSKRSFIERVQFDLEYIKSRSTLGDIIIIMKTISVVTSKLGAA